MESGGRLEHLLPAERLVLLAVAEKCLTETRQGTVRIGRIQAATGKSLRTTRRVLHKLTDADLIRVVKRGYKSHGVAKASLYELAELVPPKNGTTSAAEVVSPMNGTTSGIVLVPNPVGLVPNPVELVPPIGGTLDGSLDGSLDGFSTVLLTGANPHRANAPNT